VDPPATSPGAILDPHPLHDALVEMVVEVDEQAMNGYLEGRMPTREQLSQWIVQGVAAGSLIPIFCCSGKNEIGLQELVEGLAATAASPVDLPRVARKNGETIRLEAKSDGPLVARVFKTRIDPFVQKLSFIRIFSGQLHKDDQVHVEPVRKAIKLSGMLEVQAAETHAIPAAGPGDLVAVAKMEELHTGSVLGDYELPPVTYPTPMVGLAVMPKNRGDESKLSGALHKIVEEDPTFHLDRDQQTKELLMTGMSELHLHVIRQRLHRRDKLDVETKEPKIPFRETIQEAAEGSYRHKKQSGGRGQFGEVHLRMMPFPRGTDPQTFCPKERFPHLKTTHYDEKHHFLWVDSVVGGVIPGNFMPAIDKGFKERIEAGVIAGYTIQDVCVELFFGKHHPVDSSEAAFKTAARMAFRQVFQQARPCLLEPIVKLSITVPEANVGDVYSDMSGHGGRVLGAESAGGNLQTVSAEAPLRVVSHYARTLSSMTGGQGSYSLEFSHYDLVPPNVQQEIIAKAKLVEEEEE
jgi:elongation factor G